MEEAIRGPLVSFVLASNKPDYFAGLCVNLEETTKNPSAIEVVVYVDDGDEEMARCLDEQRRLRPFPIKSLAEPPCGYYNLWKGINKLHDLCDPRSYFVNNINDEIRFRTKHWDERLRKYIGFFPDHVFRLKLSTYKLRNYRDFWECGYAPENYAFYTKKWIDLQGNWNACHGPDAFQQMVAYRLYDARYPEKAQHNRDVVIWDIEISGEGVNVAISQDELKRRIRQGWRTWFTLVSHRMQEECNRRARHMQGYIEALAAGHKEDDFKIIDVPSRKETRVVHPVRLDILPDARWRPMRYSYRLKRWPIIWTNLRRRPFKYYYCGGEKGFTWLVLKGQIHEFLVKTIVVLSPNHIRVAKELIVDLVWRIPGLSGSVSAHASHQVVWARAWHLLSPSLHPWDSGTPIDEDTYFYLSSRRRFRPKWIVVTTHSPNGQSFLRDVSIVVRRHGLFGSGSWITVPGRLAKEAEYREKITVPDTPDCAEVVIEPDPAVMAKLRVNDIGLACFSKSKGYARNYVAESDAIIVRRMIAPQ